MYVRVIGLIVKGVTIPCSGRSAFRLLAAPQFGRPNTDQGAMGNSKPARWVAGGLVFLLVNTAYVWAFASPTIFYMANVLLHVVLGLALAAVAVALLQNRAPDAGGCRGRLCHRTRTRRFPDNRRGHSRSPLGPPGAHRDGAGRLGAADSIRAKAAPRVPKSIRDLAGLAAGLSPLGAPLRPREARPERSHLQPDARSGVDEPGRRRPTFAVLPLVRPNQHRRHHSLELLHGFRNLRRVPQGHLQPVEEFDAPLRRRSTTSSTGNPSSTCRTRRHRKPSKWCAGCHDHAVFFNGRFDTAHRASRSIRPKRSAGLACMSCHAIVARRRAPWATADSRWSTRRCMSWRPARIRYIHALDRFPHVSRSRAAPAHVPETVHARTAAEFCCHLPQGASRRSGEQLSLGARLQRLRQLAGQRRFRPGRALVLLPAESR